jgi:hypothetical protein
MRGLTPLVSYVAVLAALAIGLAIRSLVPRDDVRYTPPAPTVSLPRMPKSYACHRAPHAIAVTGRGDEPAWAAAPWTDDFVDIEGDAKPKPRFRTRARMLWDDRYLYVHAEMEEPHVWGTITQRNAVIFHDNDFEVFLDPDGDGENYHEFEMNALNTIWELTLPVRYSRGGNPINGTNLPGLISAVHVDGTLNDPRDTDRGWSVEIAFPFAPLAAYGGRNPPHPGDTWRLNFSRVEWTHTVVDGKYVKTPREQRPEDNWVWSPQGLIDMHQPEHWGYVEFVDR